MALAILKLVAAMSLAAAATASDTAAASSAEPSGSGGLIPDVVSGLADQARSCAQDSTCRGLALGVTAVALALVTDGLGDAALAAEIEEAVKAALDADKK